MENNVDEMDVGDAALKIQKMYIYINIDLIIITYIISAEK